MAKNKYNGFRVTSRILNYSYKYPVIFTLSALLGILLSFVSVLRPYLSMRAVDSAMMRGNMELLNIILIWMVAVLVAEVLFQFLFIFFSEGLAYRVVHDMRVKLFRHILSLSHKYFDQNAVGRLVTRLVSDLETISQMFGQGLFMIIGDLLKIGVIMGVMLRTNMELSLGIFLVFPALILATRIFQKSMKAAFDLVRKEVSTLNTFVQERLNGISIIQSFGAEKDQLKRFSKINERHKQAHLKTVFYFSIFLPIIELLSSLTLGILIYYAGIFNPNEVSPGVMVAFLGYTQMLFRPVRQIADKINQIQHGIVAATRVVKLLDEKPDIAFDGTLKTPIQGAIHFKDIHFSYNDKEKVLNQINLDIKAGERIGIVGETGSGKSTLVSLLVQNYVANSGEILLDNTPIQAYDIQFLKEELAYAQQDVFLFADTIRENVILGQDIPDEQIWEAIDFLDVRHFIEEQCEGLDTVLSEKGGTLSVGQRQLLAFIRIYLRKPKVLILDEATSSIDSVTEQHIQRAIGKLTKERTSIIIAHRLSTLSLCDKIVVMNHGKIEHIGTHQELLTKSVGYKTLYEQQFTLTE